MRAFLRSVYQKIWVLPSMHRRYSRLSLQETFQTIYGSQSWVQTGVPFSSGSGSKGEPVLQYCDAVVRLIRERNIRSVVDIGCGDFFVGKHIVEAANVRYIGVDIVPELIAHHQRTVKDPRVTFMHADMTRDTLPGADLCLVRQVMQHLSNQEISSAFANLKQYALLLVAEDVPKSAKEFNRDKPHGPDVRRYFGSGVYVDRAPFSQNVIAAWDIELPLSKSLLRNCLIQN